jgi:hypothetical protein
MVPVRDGDRENGTGPVSLRITHAENIIGIRKPGNDQITRGRRGMHLLTYTHKEWPAIVGLQVYVVTLCRHLVADQQKDGKE